jgi:hypothetical protein
LTNLKAQLIDGGGKILEKSLLKGYANLSGLDRLAKKTTTTPVDISILHALKQGFGKMGWAKGSELCVWTACLVAFWGAFRLGEILPKGENYFDRCSNLLWKDVCRFGKDRVVLTIRGAKVPGLPGNRVRMFSVKERLFCPVTALRSLEVLQKDRKLWDLELPVFRRSSGKNLTKSVFLKAVNATLSAQLGQEVILSGKSFRSGIPSCLETFPKSFKENHLKSLGRWKSQAYQRYMRNDDPEFKWVFQKMSNRLLKKFLACREDPTSQAETDPDPQQRQRGQ